MHVKRGDPSISYTNLTNTPYTVINTQTNGRKKDGHATCIKCNREGSLTIKPTKSKGITYQYWHIEHYIGDKTKWRYLGKYEKLPRDYKKLIHKDTQTDTQNISKSNNPNSGFFDQKEELH